MTTSQSLVAEPPRRPRSTSSEGPHSPQVFVVHRHDSSTVHELKHFLQDRLRLPEPHVLRERPSHGLTLIAMYEKFAAEAELVFVLVAPDDVGGAISTGYILDSRCCLTLTSSGGAQ